MEPLYTDCEWTVDTIQKTWEVIDKIAKEKFKLDYYPVQMEIITAEQMLNNYSSTAMPLMYDHWSFGKSFVKNEREYQKGMQGLAYEVVINTNPCIAYLMETNTMTMQALVTAHAGCGHNSFFKCNYLFQKWTDAESIVDYLKYAKNFIRACEDKYGEEVVELHLDRCHSIQYNSVDKYKKPVKLKAEVQKQKAKERNAYNEAMFSDMWRTLPAQEGSYKIQAKAGKYTFPEENLLYFIEKNSPTLETWQREICRIVRKLTQYYYPQMQTQLMNEGWATFVHYNIMTELCEQGHITGGHYLEFLASHTAVVSQPNWTRKHYSGINVYALGFAMFQDIKRICQSPTAEDLKWFPDICNTDWITTCDNIMRNYRDESFVLQFLSPKVIRDFKLFTLSSDPKINYLQVEEVHDDDDIISLRKALAASYDIGNKIPRLEIVDVNEDGSLCIDHLSEYRLHYGSTVQTLHNLRGLWGKQVELNYKDTDGNEVFEI